MSCIQWALARKRGWDDHEDLREERGEDDDINSFATQRLFRGPDGKLYLDNPEQTDKQYAEASRRSLEADLRMEKRTRGRWNAVEGGGSADRVQQKTRRNECDEKA